VTFNWLWPPVRDASDTPSPAPFSPRTAAFLFDQFVVLVSVVVPLVVAGVAVLAPANRWPIFLALMLAAFFYHFFLEWHYGTALGKRPFDLRVVADDGQTLDIRGSFVRNALRLIDGLGYWTVATVVIVYRGDGKRIGDVVGGTLVVRR
jgi:uncharacterized RDD family membrane protein YckC